MAKVRLHCAISVPEAEKELTLFIKIKGKEYKFDYTLGFDVNTASELKVGDVIEEEDLGTLSFDGIEFTDELLPSDTSGIYNRLKVENETNTYLVAKFTLINYKSEAESCMKFIGLRAKYLGKYKYTGFAAMEDDDGKGFSRAAQIVPLATRKLFYLIEVPDSVIDKEVALTLSFGTREYIFTGKPEYNKAGLCKQPRFVLFRLIFGIIFRKVSVINCVGVFEKLLTVILVVKHMVVNSLFIEG